MVFVLTKYVLKRLVYIVVVFFIVSFLMYCLFSLIPSDRARTQLEPLKQQLKPEVYEQMYRDLREQMGLDDPIILRYLRWMGLAKDKMTGEFNGILEGYFGYSQMRQRDAIDVIKAPMGNTILFNLVTTILTLAVTIPLGIWCSVHKNSKFDQGVQAVTILGYSIPQYIIAGACGHLLPRMAQRFAAGDYLYHRLVPGYFLRLFDFGECVLSERHG